LLFIGAMLSIDGRPYTVAGVLAPWTHAMMAPRFLYRLVVYARQEQIKVIYG